MTQASDFNNIMRYLWGDNEPTQPFIIRAIADNIRGRRGVNPENAFDVLYLLNWPHKMYIRTSEIESEPHIAVAHVTFDDESQIIIEAPHGIGSGVEIVQG